MVKSIRLLQYLAGIIITAVLIYSIKGDIKNLERVNLVYFIFAIAMYDLLNVIIAYRVHYLLKKIGYSPKFTCTFAANIGGMVAGDVTPGRSGYISAAKLLDKCGIPISDAMAALISPQGIDFVVKGVGAMLAITILGFSNPIAGFGVVAIGIFILVFMWYEKPLKILSKITPKKVIKFAEKLGISKIAGEIVSSGVETRKYALQILALCLIGWVCVGIQWFFIGHSCGVIFPVYVYFLLHPLLSALMFVPLTPAGLGIMESGSVLVLYALGIPPAKAAVFAILVRLSCVLADLPGVIAWMHSGCSHTNK